MTSSDLVAILAAVLNALIVAGAQISTARGTPAYDIKGGSKSYWEWYERRMRMYGDLLAINVLAIIPITLIGALIMTLVEQVFGEDSGRAFSLYYFAAWICMWFYIFMCFLFDRFKHP